MYNSICYLTQLRYASMAVFNWLTAVIEGIKMASILTNASCERDLYDKLSSFAVLEQSGIYNKQFVCLSCDIDFAINWRGVNMVNIKQQLNDIVNF